MYTNMTGFRSFSKALHPCALDKSSLCIGKINTGLVRLVVYTKEYFYLIDLYKKATCVFFSMFDCISEMIGS